MKNLNLTRGKILPSLLSFSLPMLAGNLLQQAYNLADTLIVGQVLGAEALAAVGSAYSLMTFLTSLVIGLCMGSGAVFSELTGAGDEEQLKRDIFLSAVFIFGTTLLLTAGPVLLQDRICTLLQIPPEVAPLMKQYTGIVLYGTAFTGVYNFYAYLVRARGNSLAPMLFLMTSSFLNIALDLLFVAGMRRGIAGAAEATLIAQGVSAAGMAVYAWAAYPQLRVRIPDSPQKGRLRWIVLNDLASGLQQSVMNFGILMIQGLVNTFGTTVMAAFSVCVKIDTLAYMPAQEFGNAYSLFISQNHGAKLPERVKKGSRAAAAASAAYCAVISVLIWIAAPVMVGLFLNGPGPEIIREGTRYLRIEGACYAGIGILFLMYGYFRGIQKPQISLLLTVISLGTRVAVSYAFAPVSPLGVSVIWMSIPLGWALADLTGFVLMRRQE